MQPSRTAAVDHTIRRFLVASIATLLALVWAVPHSKADDAAPLELTVVSFNVLVDFGSHPEVPSWKKRRELCVKMLQETQADLIGLQETSPGQLRYLMGQLPDYTAHYYKRRENDPGFPDAALLYDRRKFEEIEKGHWWLSPTPERVSTGFGNTLPRLVVWAKLRHKPTGRELYFFDTHFDNSRPSQTKMAECCRQQMEPFRKTNLPMVFAGDFNTDQDRGDYPKLTSDGWRDSYLASDKATADGHDDNVPTFRNGTRIDHIFYRGPGGTALSWQRLESSDPDRPLSDHFPIRAQLRFE